MKNEYDEKREIMKDIILDEEDVRERSFFESLRTKVRALLDLLPKVPVTVSRLQPLPVMDLLNELVNQHLATAEELSATLVACREHYDHKLKKMFQGGVFKSLDGGLTWRRVFEDRFASRVRVSPFDSDVVYIGTTDHPYHDFATGRGVFASRDGGKTWQEINNGLTVKQVGVITLDPNDPKRIYAGTGGNGLFIGTWE